MFRPVTITFLWCLSCSSFLFSGLPANADHGSYRAGRDSIIHMDEVVVGAYFVRQPLLRSTSAAAIVGQHLLQAQQGTNLLPALNTVPGVRMEERSPGSYRLSIRGSLLRSPFGVRNVKVYLDDIPLTDAGGNTYLNLLDPVGLEGAEILKGPDGSLFGANSGGVVILRSDRNNRFGNTGSPDQQNVSHTDKNAFHTDKNAFQTDNKAKIQLQSGSFGLLHQQASYVTSPHPRYRMSWQQAYQRSDGYRAHSALDKLYLQTRHQWQYSETKPNQLRLTALYGDMKYQTPGGLTAAQFEEDPSAARPGSGTIPGPVEQKAGIYNRTLIAGLTHEWYPFAGILHHATLFGSHTGFRNPFITNYERREEGNKGFRTYFSYAPGLPIFSSIPDLIVQVQTGIEWQTGSYKIDNYDNIDGVPGPAQAMDQLWVQTGTTFARLALDYRSIWMIEGAFSHNFQKNQFRELFPSPEKAYSKGAQPAEWMPRVAVSYQPHPAVALRALVSKGFSPPTTAEIRPSDNIINTDLKAETGWNREAGLRYQTAGHRFFVDLSLFNYRMENALVRGSRDNGAEYFRNAGKIDQKGLELLTQIWLTRPTDVAAMFQVCWTGSWAWSRFRFLDYRINELDFSGNALTGVPRHSLSNSLRFIFPGRWECWLTHQFTSSIPLNDANTVYADSYQLLQAKISRSIPLLLKDTPLWLSDGAAALEVFAGGDNLLDQRYSLGNDINAFGGRYFNAAPPRNFYAGLSLHF